MNRTVSFGLLAGLVALLAVAVWIVVDGVGDGPDARTHVRAGLSAAEALAGSDTAGFARAMAPRPFEFPRDHGPHPDYRTEWWYLTGNLESDGGRPFGFQLTFFRSALSPTAPDRPSAWNTNQLWMAHFALTDIEAGSHIVGERFARGAAGLAGGQAEPFRVWLHDWEIRGLDDSGAFPMVLEVEQEGVELRLELDEGKGPVPQGIDGWSQKGPEPGNASYYLSWTRMPTRGHVTIGGDRHTLRGNAWMDREWSTSALGEANTGWDWFSLQLDDGREVMFFELRRDDGEPDPMNHGSLVGVDGEARRLGAGDVTLEVLDRWESPVDGALYPARWRMQIPDEELDLTITPRVADQEMVVSFRYWEGAVTVDGTSGSGPVGGLGYVELTGYAEDGGTRGAGSGSE